MRADHDRVDACAEIVDVRDDDRARRRARRALRASPIARAPRTGRRGPASRATPPVRVAEEPAVRREPQRDHLREPERLAEPRSATCALHGRVGREARHQRDGNVDAERRGETAVSPSLTSRNCGRRRPRQRAFTTPPNRVAIPPPRTTCATLPSRSALDPASRPRSKPGVARGREHGEVVGERRLDRPRDDGRSGDRLPSATRALRRSKRPRPEAAPLAGSRVLRDRSRPGSSRAHRRWERSRYGARCTPSSVTIAVDQIGGGHVERRVVGGESRRHLGPVALLDHDPGARRCRRVDRRGRRDDDERKPVMRASTARP